MGLYESALREFEILEYLNKDSKEEDTPIILNYKNEILEILKKFAESGQSGGSAPYTAAILGNTIKDLCLYKTLSPITGIDSEWNDVTEMMQGDTVYQNNRCSAIFKDGKEGKAYYLDAIIFKGEDQWDTFTGEVEGIRSRQTIKTFPFTPKTFYIDVVREKVDVDPHDKKVQESRFVTWGDGVYLYHIKDPSQLEEVFEYYEKREEE